MKKGSYYTPGVCNINQEEVAYRRKGFYLGLIMAVPTLFVLALMKAMPILGIVMFVPIWIAAIGYLQAKHKFCVGFAASGVYSSSDKFADTARTIGESSSKLDQARAQKINTQALLIGTAGAVASIALLAALQSM